LKIEICLAHGITPGKANIWSAPVLQFILATRHLGKTYRPTHATKPFAGLKTIIFWVARTWAECAGTAVPGLSLGAT